MRQIMESLRWTFKCGAWVPDSAEWIHAAQCVQPEEKTRIGRFVFKRDAKSAMAGRLLMRKAISDCLGIEYDKVRLGRTEKGKPYLLDNLRANDFSFNISHQGDYAVLAAERRYNVGVDIMKTEIPRGKSVQEYFHTMRRQLTEHEWSTIRSENTERRQLEMFYRFWCLKESYLKALGLGIGFTLSRLSFRIQTPRLSNAYLVTDTKLLVDGELAANWTFEESLLDDDHTVAVAVTPLGSKNVKLTDRDTSTLLFRPMTFRDLTLTAEPLTDPDEQYWAAFNSKEEMPPGLVGK